MSWIWQIAEGEAGCTVPAGGVRGKRGTLLNIVTVRSLSPAAERELYLSLGDQARIVSAKPPTATVMPTGVTHAVPPPGGAYRKTASAEWFACVGTDV